MKNVFLTLVLLACSVHGFSKEQTIYTFSDDEIADYRQTVCSNMDKPYDCESLAEIRISDICQKKNSATYSLLEKKFPLLKFEIYRERCSISSYSAGMLYLDVQKDCKSLSKNRPLYQEVVFDCIKLEKRYKDPKDKARTLETEVTTLFFPTKLQKDTFEARKQLALYIFSISGIERSLLESTEKRLKNEWEENTEKVKKIDFRPSFKVLENNIIEVKVLDYSRCPSKLSYITTKIYADTEKISVISTTEEVIVDMKIDDCIV